VPGVASSSNRQQQGAGVEFLISLLTLDVLCPHPLKSDRKDDSVAAAPVSGLVVWGCDAGVSWRVRGNISNESCIFRGPIVFESAEDL